MFKDNKIWGREPALFYGVIQAAIVLLVAFGLKLDSTQTGAILTFTTMILAFATRQAVVPNATHEAQVSEALYAPKPNVEDLTLLSPPAVAVKKELAQDAAHAAVENDKVEIPKTF